MSQQQSKDTMSVVIEEGENFLRVRVHGELMYNYHDRGYDMMHGKFGDLVVYVLGGDYHLLEMFVEQLRNGGYFNAK